MSRPVPRAARRPLSAAALAVLLMVLMVAPARALLAPLVVGAGEQHHSLGLHLEYFRDVSGKMDVAAVSRLPDSAFTPCQHEIPNFSFTSDHVWLRLRVHWRAPDRQDYALWQQYPLTDYFTVYRPDGRGGFIASHTGDQLPFAQRERPLRAFGFPLTPHPGQIDTYYVELHGAGTINVDLQLSSENAAFAETESRHLLYGLFYGAVIALLLYNFILAFSLRESVYFYYTIFVAGLGLVFFDINGLAFRYLWPDTVWMNSGFMIFAYISMFAQVQFTRQFLDLKRQWPVLDALFLLFIPLLLVAAVLVVVGPSNRIYALSQQVIFILVVLSLVAGAGLWRRGYRLARYFAIASGVYVLGCLVYVLQNFGLIPTTLLSNHAIQIGASFEMILYSFALADRINHIQREKAQVEEKARLQLQSHNQTLELRVRERTEELSQSLLEVKEKHQALVATQQQLVQAEKMSSLGGLVAGVAHEINNPANFTRLAAENIRRDLARMQEFLYGLAGDDSDPALLAELEQHFSRIRQQLALVHDGTQRLARIVSDLRHFSRLDESESQLACPGEGLAATLNLVRAQYGDRLQIVLQEGDQQASGLCYPAALNQVFMNLAVNACQAIVARAQQEGRQALPLGKLQVETAVFLHEGRCYWQARFQDDGQGMDAATQQHIFEPFFTTKGVGEGTGLGLSVSYGIIRKHHGEIQVSSLPGVGSCFTLNIPLQTQDQEQVVLPDTGGEHHGTV